MDVATVEVLLVRGGFLKRRVFGTIIGSLCAPQDAGTFGHEQRPFRLRVVPCGHTIVQLQVLKWKTVLPPFGASHVRPPIGTRAL